MTLPLRVRNERGFSLVEVLIAVSILAFGLLALASAGGRGLSEMSRSREDMRYSAAVQQEIDSLIGRGWNNVATGSSTIQGRVVSWTVTAAGANSQLLTIIAQRHRYTNYAQVVQDTIIMYLAAPTPGS